MEREYIIIEKPNNKIPLFTVELEKLDDDFWKKWIFYFLLEFYKNHDKNILKSNIENEKKKEYPQVEKKIAKFMRRYLKNNAEFSSHFCVLGESINDEEKEGFYDITINNTYWKSKNFHFECKNLDENNLERGDSLVNKYICHNTYKKKDNQYIFDGGILRYFNGKYAQELNFGGMIGFVLGGNTDNIKSKIIEQLKVKLPTTPDGDLIKIKDNSINENKFTFDSIHSRKNIDFTIHHLLFDFTI